MVNVQQDEPDDYVISTGKQESVRNFINLAAKNIGWGGIQWEGHGIDEVGKRKDNHEIVVKIDPGLFRPAEVDTLLEIHRKLEKG